MNTSTNQSIQFDLQGHRGCRGLMPENTLPAMLHALDLGVTTLELDVVISADKQVVVSHEPWMSSEITTKKDGAFVLPSEERQLNLYKMTYQEITQYDVGLKPHPRFPEQKKMKAVKPLLSDVIDSVHAYVTSKGLPAPYWNIETKLQPEGDDLYHPPPQQFVELLLAVLHQKSIGDYVTIQSFDKRTLQVLHQKKVAVQLALLIEENDTRTFSQQIDDLGFLPQIYSPHYSLVNASLVSTCHQQGVKIIPWTVNDAAKMAQLKAMGVDGLITDYPNRFQLVSKQK